MSERLEEKIDHLTEMVFDLRAAIIRVEATAGQGGKDGERFQEEIKALQKRLGKIETNHHKHVAWMAGAAAAATGGAHLVGRLFM